MKRVFSWIFILFVVFVIGSAFLYLFKKSHADPVVYQTEKPEMTDIIKKTVATGSIVPRQQVDVKPKVTGVLSKLYVEPGAIVKQGDPLGKITIIADAMQVNQGEASVRSAQIAFENAKRELDRNEALFKQGVVADAELQKYRTDYAMARQQLETAGSNLQLVKEGATRGQGNASTLIVTATVPGMVIDVPVKEGFSVIQANNFNPGTTVATIADMTDIIFDGHVDEAEVAKIKEGMTLTIKVGAIENQKLEGKLEYIAPQGKLIDGAIQFEIKASVKLDPKITIRANYSANADIILDQKKGVLAVREALVQYEPAPAGTTGSAAMGKPFVEVETTVPQHFEKRSVELGLSDGIKVEITSKNLQVADKLKIPDNAGPAQMGSAGAPPPKK